MWCCLSASGFDFARFCAVGGFPVRSICVVGAGGFRVFWWFRVFLCLWACYGTGFWFCWLDLCCCAVFAVGDCICYGWLTVSASCGVGII